MELNWLLAANCFWLCVFAEDCYSVYTWRGEVVHYNLILELWTDFDFFYGWAKGIVNAYSL